MSNYMNTGELSRYLGINEKKVYTLVTEGGLPGTKVTGKWIFIKDLVDMWIENSVENYPAAMSRLKGTLMMGGSDDPLFDVTIREMQKASSAIFPFFCKTGSLGGLSLLRDHKAHLCASHLLDSKKEEYNLPFIDSYLPDFRIVTVNFACRQQGLIVKAGNPLRLRRVEDLMNPGIRLINRQKGSGTRVLLDSYLKKLCTDGTKIKGYDTEATTHFDVGLKVLRGLADVGVGIKMTANALGLGFVPLRKERFDILIPRDSFLLEQVQTFVEILKSRQFQRRASEFGGYDTRISGKVIYAS
jgi:excisionase family DNA binding protein